MLVLFVTIRTLFVYNENGDEKPIEDILSSLHDGDIVKVGTSVLSAQQTSSLFKTLNASGLSQLHVVGSPTIFDGSLLHPVDVALEGSKLNLSLTAIHFSNFSSGILHCQNSLVKLTNCCIVGCSFFETAPFAFLNSVVTITDLKVLQNDVFDQSLVVGYATEFECSRIEIHNNTIKAEYHSPLLHLLDSRLIVSNVSMAHNLGNCTCLHASNSTTVHLSKFNITNSSFLCMGAFEHSTEVAVDAMTIDNYHGSLLFASDGARIRVSNIICDHIWCETFLVLLSNSIINIWNAKHRKLNLSGFLLANMSHVTMHNIEFNRCTASNALIEMHDTTIDLNLGLFHNIHSRSETAVFLCDGAQLNLKSADFQNISAVTPVCMAISTYNAALLLISSCKFLSNFIGCCMCDRGTIILNSSVIQDNQCFPEYTKPFSILVLSSCDSVEIKDSKVINNRAVTGTLLLVNTSATITGSAFNDNNAVEGAAVFAKRSSINIMSCEFAGNVALANGGVFRLQESNLEVVSSTVKHNFADQGGVVYASQQSTVVVRKTTSKANEAATGIFSYSTESKIALDTVAVEVSPEKAIFIDSTNDITLVNALFNCAAYCQAADSLTGKDDDPAELKQSPQRFIYWIGFLTLTLVCLMPFVPRRMRLIRYYCNYHSNKYF